MLIGLVYFSEILHRSVGKMSFTPDRLENPKFATNWTSILLLFIVNLGRGQQQFSSRLFFGGCYLSSPNSSRQEAIRKSQAADVKYPYRLRGIWKCKWLLLEDKTKDLLIFPNTDAIDSAKTRFNQKSNQIMDEFHTLLIS